MKLLNNSVVLIASLVATVAVHAASATFVKKETNKQGKTEYIYKYTCSNNSQGQIAVVSDSDDKAYKMAQEKAKVVCEE
jgi:hypothetical protein